MTVTNVSFLFLLIIAVMGIVTVTGIYRREENLSWKTIKNNLLIWPKFRFSVALIALIYVGIFSAFYQHSVSQTASAVITLNYSEASKGQNANGTRYNMSEIISDEIMERAIKKGALEHVGAQTLRQCFSVTPVVEGSSFDENRYHISTEFQITFRKNKETAHLDAQNVVRLAAEAYKEYYIDTYADNFSALEISIDPDRDYTDVDYMDIAQHLQMQAETVTHYMYGLADKNASFTSSSGTTFLSLAEKGENIKKVQIADDFQSYLLQNGISKDAEKYVGRLSYDNKRYDYDYQRAKAAFDVRNRAVNLYAEEMTRVVLVPTWDREGEYYMGRTKVGIDTLSVEAEEYSKQAAQSLKRIETNKAIIDTMSEVRKNGDNKYADHLIANIGSEIVELSKAARQIGQEYSEKRLNGCISINVWEPSFAKYAVFCFGFFVLFYLMLGIFVQTVKLPLRKKDIGNSERMI